MEMELMENGLTQEEQAMQPDAVPELEPSGPDVPEPAENEVSEEPPKKKRTSRKKTEKAADDPAPIPGNTLEEGEDLPAPEDASLEDDPLGEGLSQADQLDPEPTAAADGIVVMGLVEQDVSGESDMPTEEPEPGEAAVPPLSQPDAPEPERTRPAAPRARRFHHFSSRQVDDSHFP